ncbi:MAG: class I SAM-dependent methyltransferase [Rhodoferax sp.]|uniref:class I SAM-dependent methyltransferase n=1 Tax=Rhodoferax sp. TaxID=50421 RepID=UPI00271B316A|nr:class I SAM-dependent methyltransferase [Rhodoferax sp.]MDO8450875.1 class I SAM-dependent methyltransferase [Rhodoferax sp.]
MDITSQSQYYDQYWASHKNDLNHHEICRLAEIFSALGLIKLELGEQQHLSICDLGCGRGWLSDYLSRFGSVTAVDFSQEAVHSATSRYPNIEFICANVLNYSPSKKFDLVLSSEVIEHIDDQTRYAEVISSILKPGGLLLMTCPNGLQKSAWKEVNDSEQVIEKWLTPSTLKGLLKPNLDIIRQETFYLYFSYRGFRRLFNAPKFKRLMSTIGMLRLVEVLRCQAGAGLYQLVVARKR